MRGQSFPAASAAITMKFHDSARQFHGRFASARDNGYTRERSLSHRTPCRLRRLRAFAITMRVRVKTLRASADASLGFMQSGTFARRICSHGHCQQPAEDRRFLYSQLAAALERLPPAYSSPRRNASRARSPRQHGRAPVVARFRR